MKKVWVFLVMLLVLTGCGEAEVFETVGDEAVQPVMAQPREMKLTLPEDTILPAMETDSGTLYMCVGYDITVQTMESGDLGSTVRQVTGCEIGDLTVITTEKEGVDCYEFVWTAAGDMGEQVCRGMVLDDGAYHYILTAMAAAELVGEYQEIWNGIFESCTLA